MLKKIRLKNFKLHENTEIEAGRITVFIGPNNSGKSSIFQALLALKSAARSGADGLVRPHRREAPPPAAQPAQAEPSLSSWLRPAELPPFLYGFGQPIVDLGEEYQELLHDRSCELQIGADVELPTPTGASREAKAFGAFHVTFDLFFSENRLARHTGQVACNYGKIPAWDWAPGKAGGGVRGTLPIPSYHGELYVNPGGNPGQPFYCSLSLPAEKGTPTLRGEMQRLADVWSRFLESLHLVHQLRGFEEWGYPTTEYPAHESLERLVLTDRATALTNLLGANAKLRTAISERLKELVGIGIEFETASAHRGKVWATAAKTGRPETLFVNEGSGANQLPFILVPIALAQSGDAVIVSEPEAHLHPKAQSQLTAMLLEISRKAELQFFIETHSEHVLHRLLHAVAKGELAKDDLALYYFENEGGRAKATRLAVNDHGQVDGGLPGFYDQSLDELTEYLDALRKH